MACPAGEKDRTDVLLERADLPADRRLREVQLFGGDAKARVPGHGLEGAHGSDGDGSLAER
jgi:hypothetical protein